jgi:hypothetical protein
MVKKSLPHEAAPKKKMKYKNTNNPGHHAHITL